MKVKFILVILCLVINFKVALAQESIYTIPLSWQNETQTKITLSNYQGHFVVITMIYTTCQSACPLMMKKIRKIQDSLGDFKNTEFVIVTFDPSHDTPQNLLKYKKAQKVDYPHWHFLHGTEEDTRKLSLLLDIGYQKNVKTGHFMHDNKIILLNPEGEMIHTLDGLDTQISPLLKAMGHQKLSFFEKLKHFFKLK